MQNPTTPNTLRLLKSYQFQTPLGDILAVANAQALFLLDFCDNPRLSMRLERLKKQTQSEIVEGLVEPIQQVQEELQAYFEGKLKRFKTPLAQGGTPFQNKAWEALCQIPYAETRSYLDQAKSVGKPTAARAVALSNAANYHVIVVPCHRVIQQNGKLGGFGCGIERKKWLLEHEKRHVSRSSSQ